MSGGGTGGDAGDAGAMTGDSGSSDAGGMKGDAGDAQAQWCEDCSLGPQMDALAIEGAIDCGSVREPSTLEGDEDAGFDDEPLECVRDALEDGVAFNLVVDQYGIDSDVSKAWVGLEDGTFWFLTYDSHICGGDGCTDRCGPSVSRRLCMAPMQADTPQQLVKCAQPLGERESVCGPPGG